MADPELAVLFDLDGLLADTEPIWTESADILLQRRGHAFDPALKPLFMGRRTDEVSRLLVERYELPDRPQDLLAERLAIMEELYATDRLAPLPGALELVAELHRRQMPMAVVSGSPDHLIRIVLESLQLIEPLGCSVSSDTVKRGKPAPDCYLLAARRLGVDPRCCVVLEDAPAGVQAALAAGMTCVAVPGPEISLEQVASAHLTVSSLTELSLHRLAELAKSRRA
jgi:pseudouridine-5'-monophosphatase